MPINIKNMKGLDFSCTSPASTAICSSTDQRYMVKNTTKSLTRLNSYLNDHYKNFTNNNIINTNNYSFSPRAPCISELPFTPRLSSSYREKTRKKPPSSSVVKHSDLTTPRRNSSVDIAEVRRRYYDKCTYNGSCSPPHSHSSRYLLGESKFLDSLHESSHHQSKITKNRKFSNSNNDDDALALIPSTPILSKEAHETKSFGSFLDAEKDNKKISKSLVLVNNNSSDRNDIKSNNKVDYDGINQRQKSMGYGRNDSLVVKKSSSSGARSRDQVVVLRVSLHCKGCEGKLRKHLSKMEGVTSFSIDLETKKVTVIGNVTPLSVLTSISKVKNAQFWPSQASASPSSSSSSSTSSSTVDFN
ncbi:protein SODIUM POTASSIUM ROOT DEFECTIVE 1-like [Chenopodium quinoa]|uniref:protein SODIUM POTASSIUM ROOT DEFECTIVE 1-like n=1 Tax=Chenopodium quinoa TaxID=63459 RepID=UPI000B789FDA|nr:protein SODIUM POTASSIUM ROOT DEFECTIVE 1-like [Chenopodium quinoa]